MGCEPRAWAEGARSGVHWWLAALVMDKGVCFSIASFSMTSFRFRPLVGPSPSPPCMSHGPRSTACHHRLAQCNHSPLTTRFTAPACTLGITQLPQSLIIRGHVPPHCSPNTSRQQSPTVRSTTWSHTAPTSHLVSTIMRVRSGRHTQMAGQVQMITANMILILAVSDNPHLYPFFRHPRNLSPLVTSSKAFRASHASRVLRFLH